MLQKYIELFHKLRADRNAGWPLSSLGRSPYKPLLLLAVFDLFESGEIANNLIQVTPDLGDIFNIYCSIVISTEWKCNIAMPFYHLHRDGFWHLLPKPGKEAVIEAGRRLQSVSLLEEYVYGARLDEDLYELICVKENRDILRTVLIQTYFDSSIHNQLIERSLVNLESFQYSQTLIEQARQPHILKEKPPNVSYSTTARDQGFRRTIVMIYEHRCAFCELRMVTADGHTVVDAAHIIPRHVSYNDEPTNGIALCKLCHWTFDKGLFSVSAQYKIMVSPQIHHAQNAPKHLISLDRKAIVVPNNEAFWPNKQSFQWHRDNKLRKV